MKEVILNTSKLNSIKTKQINVETYRHVETVKIESLDQDHGKN
jgi:hypothetical protein